MSDCFPTGCFFLEINLESLRDYLFGRDKQKSLTILLNWAGASRLQTWPASLITLSVDPGIAACIWCATLIGDRLSFSPQTNNVGTLIVGRILRVSAFADDIAINRKPTGWKSDMVFANFSRASGDGESPNIPGKYFDTNSLGCSEASRRQVSNRSSTTGCGNEPFQPA